MIEQEIEQIQVIYNLLTEFLVEYSFQLIGAIVILFIGWYIAKKASAFTLNLCAKHDIDTTLASFIANVLKIVIIVMVAIIAMGKIGISVTPFVAAIGALSLGAGFALQGLLSNYGAGLTIILARPFVVHDTIQIKGITGIVKSIQLAHTIITNEDGEEILIPNKHIVGEILHNSFKHKLVEGSIGISYASNPAESIKIIQQTLNQIEEIAQEPAPLVGIDQFGDSAIEIGMRYSVPTDNYFQIKYKANLLVLEALKSAGVDIPFPQREVRILE